MIRTNYGKTVAAAVVLTLVGGLPTTAANYAIDMTHSQIQFSVKHLGISTVTGKFSTFEGVLEFDPEAMGNGRVEVVIDAASIDTAVEKRDEHLRSADFFNVAEHPELRFESTSVETTEEGLIVRGDLTISGVTRPVALEAVFSGRAVDPWGNSRVGFEASTTINRKDFGLTWNKILESGGLLVSEEVKISLVVQGIEQVPDAAPAS
jgi:polyisoprenoid-binding protein YceI